VKRKQALQRVSRLSRFSVFVVWSLREAKPLIRFPYTSAMIPSREATIVRPADGAYS
jgi:hypothetical protein